jgi:hypothetical protein
MPLPSYLVEPVAGPRLIRPARMPTGSPDGAGVGASAAGYGTPA